MTTSVVPAPWRTWAAGLAALAFLAVGSLGAFRYVANYWVYRGFAPPRDAPFVRAHGTSERFYVASAALGGRRQPVDVYLPPGYASHPHRRYPVMVLLHGVPGRPGAFVDTVRLGVVQDELVALHKARAMILVMPYGSTGSFTDKEWVDGVRRNEGWETFVARDLRRAVDARYRTIRSGASRVLAGLSEGGYGALDIAIHHPGEYRVVESWSGYELADPVPSVFGGDRPLLRHDSPLLTVRTAAPALRRNHTYFWLYTGSGDRELRQNDRFAHLLAALHLPHRYLVVHGGHDWGIWRGHAAGAYLAASRRIRGA